MWTDHCQDSEKMLRLKLILHDNVKARITYAGQKLGRKFQIKDKTRDSEPTFNEHYWKKLEEELLKV